MKNNILPFLKRLKQKHFGQSSSQTAQRIKTQHSVSIIQSDTLGMTIVQNQNDYDHREQMNVLTPEEWVMAIYNGSLKGISFARIYFSFLKGIPDYMRIKIWLFFCSQNSTKNFKFTVESMPQNLIQQLGLKELNGRIELKQISMSLYLKLVQLKPLQKQEIQIVKDVHRTYSKRTQYKYTNHMLKKILIALSNSGIQYSQGMNYILLNVMIYCLQSIGIVSQELFEAVNEEIQKNHSICIR